MGWFTSLFALPDNSQHSRKGQALSSTHEAFSLPTSSPTRSPTSVAHAEAFHPEPLQTPDLDTGMTPSYTYPPQGPGAYGYVPTSAGLNSRPVSASLLPTHHDPSHSLLSPKFQYPPLSNTWNRLRAWLDREYPELGDTLNYGILPQDLEQVEMQFGFALPPAIRDSYLCVNGQEAESAAGCSEGLFFGLKLLPLEDVLQEWRFWREVDNDPATGSNSRLREVMQSIPPGWIRMEYSQRGWIPLIADKVGNYIGVDLNPDEKGAVGQVIVFGRDFDTKVVLYMGDGPAGWAKWLASFVDELESGEGIEIGLGTDGSDGSEDDLGYESYFYEGSGRGQGDGGGDTGSGGGLRLAGDYRGWDVLEALADRSLRRWHEAGVIIDTSISPVADESKLSGHIVLDLTNESSTQVGIPVLSDVDDPIPAPTIASNIGHFTNEVQNTEHQESRNPPIISITRAPAPLPVELPTAHDILPTSIPDSSQSSFDEDLESGRNAGMSESPSLLPPSRRSRATSPSRETSEASRVVHSTSDLSLKSRSTTPLSINKPSTSQKADIPDLLMDSAPAMDTMPITPTPTSPIPPRSELLVSVKEPATSDDIQDAENAVENSTSRPANVEEVDPNVTIRLIGGGGTVGIVNAQEDESPFTEDTDTDASIASKTTDSTPEAVKTHKKTKSGLAGLKKLGNIGRKRDSKSDMKDTSKANPVAI